MRLPCCGGFESSSKLIPPRHTELSREELRDLYERSIAANGGRLIVHGILARADTKNNNKRVYPKRILKREAARYLKEHVRKGTALGELDHPSYSSKFFKCLNLPNISHQVLDMWWVRDCLWGTLEVLPTPSGLMLWELYSQGVRLGVSSRGWASLRTDPTTKCVYVDDDYELITFDFVNAPSTRDAYLVPVMVKYRGLAASQGRCVQLSHVGYGVVAMRKIQHLPSAGAVLERVEQIRDGVHSKMLKLNPLLGAHPLDNLLLFGHYCAHPQEQFLQREEHIRDLCQHIYSFAIRAYLAMQAVIPPPNQLPGAVQMTHTTGQVPVKLAAPPLQPSASLLRMDVDTTAQQGSADTHHRPGDPTLSQSSQPSLPTMRRDSPSLATQASGAQSDPGGVDANMPPSFVAAADVMPPSNSAACCISAAADGSPASDMSCHIVDSSGAADSAPASSAGSNPSMATNSRDNLSSARGRFKLLDSKLMSVGDQVEGLGLRSFSGRRGEQGGVSSCPSQDEGDGWGMCDEKRDSSSNRLLALTDGAHPNWSMNTGISAAVAASSDAIVPSTLSPPWSLPPSSTSHPLFTDHPPAQLARLFSDSVHEQDSISSGPIQSSSKPEDFRVAIKDILEPNGHDQAMKGSLHKPGALCDIDSVPDTAIPSPAHLMAEFSADHPVHTLPKQLSELSKKWEPGAHRGSSQPAAASCAGRMWDAELHGEDDTLFGRTKDTQLGLNPDHFMTGILPNTISSPSEHKAPSASQSIQLGSMCMSQQQRCGSDWPAVPAQDTMWSLSSAAPLDPASAHHNPSVRTAKWQSYRGFPEVTRERELLTFQSDMAFSTNSAARSASNIGMQARSPWNDSMKPPECTSSTQASHFSGWDTSKADISSAGRLNTVASNGACSAASASKEMSIQAHPVVLDADSPSHVDVFQLQHSLPNHDKDAYAAAPGPSSRGIHPGFTLQAHVQEPTSMFSPNMTSSASHGLMPFYHSNERQYAPPESSASPTVDLQVKSNSYNSAKQYPTEFPSSASAQHSAQPDAAGIRRAASETPSLLSGLGSTNYPRSHSFEQAPSRHRIPGTTNLPRQPVYPCNSSSQLTSTHPPSSVMPSPSGLRPASASCEWRPFFPSDADAEVPLPSCIPTITKPPSPNFSATPDISWPQQDDHHAHHLDLPHDSKFNPHTGSAAISENCGSGVSAACGFKPSPHDYENPSSHRITQHTIPTSSGGAPQPDHSVWRRYGPNFTPLECSRNAPAVEPSGSASRHGTWLRYDAEGPESVTHARPTADACEHHTGALPILQTGIGVLGYLHALGSHPQHILAPVKAASCSDDVSSDEVCRVHVVDTFAYAVWDVTRSRMAEASAVSANSTCSTATLPNFSDRTFCAAEPVLSGADEAADHCDAVSCMLSSAVPCVGGHSELLKRSLGFCSKASFSQLAGPMSEAHGCELFPLVASPGAPTSPVSICSPTQAQTLSPQPTSPPMHKSLLSGTAGSGNLAVQLTAPSAADLPELENIRRLLQQYVQRYRQYHSLIAQQLNRQGRLVPLL